MQPQPADFTKDWGTFYKCMFGLRTRATCNFSETFFEHIQEYVRVMYSHRFSLGHFIAEAERDLSRTDEKTKVMKKMQELHGNIVMTMAHVVQIVDLPQAEIDKEDADAYCFVFPDKDAWKEERYAKFIADGRIPNDARCAADVAVIEDSLIDSQDVYEKFCRMFYGIHDEPPLRGSPNDALKGDLVHRDPILRTLDPVSDAYESRSLMLCKLSVLRDIATKLQTEARLAEEKKQREREARQLQLRLQEESACSYRTR